MAQSYKRRVPEQTAIMADYNSPTAFFYDYIQMHFAQLECSTKIYPEHVPYFSEFQVSFLTYVLDDAINSPLDSLSLIHLSNSLYKFSLSSSSHDKFLISSLDSLYKSFKLVISRVESLILCSDYSHVSLLYEYSDEPVDLYGQLSADLCKSFKYGCLIRFSRTINNLKLANINIKNKQPAKIIKKMKQNNEQRCIIPTLLGDKRIEEYSEEELFSLATEKYIREIDDKFIDYGYVNMINVTDMLYGVDEYIRFAEYMKERANTILEIKMNGENHKVN